MSKHKGEAAKRTETMPPQRKVAGKLKTEQRKI